MDTQNIKEQDRRREAALQRHAQLHRLFVEDRLAFERERKKTIDEFLNSIEDPGKRDRLKALQESWDNRLRHAGSSHNRFVLAKAFFWSHFRETWQPAIQQFNTILKEMDPGLHRRTCTKK
ncbi:MAG: DUF3135 domain-containing protein [Desulfatiglandales bacterium]